MVMMALCAAFSMIFQYVYNFSFQESPRKKPKLLNNELRFVKEAFTDLTSSITLLEFLLSRHLLKCDS
jgi:hypothetical protein